MELNLTNSIIIFLCIITLSYILLSSSNNKNTNKAIIIGSGLAGSSAALTILEKGGSVVIMEKQDYTGGNSSKASSGINGSYTKTQQSLNIKDSVEQYKKDTTKSTNRKGEPYNTLVNTLVTNTSNAIDWLQSKNVNLNSVAILGGHANARTHRPDSNVLAGIEIISKLTTELNKYSRLTIIKNTTVVSLLKEGNKVVGVSYQTNNESVKNMYSNVVVLATGGYANDHSNSSLLYKHRPELKHLPTTNSSATTGDGVKMGMLIGALTRDLNEIQVHPTGFIDPEDKTNKTKVLCAEVVRGIGAILVNSDGERFCNELGTRQYVVDMMNKQKIKKFAIVLSSKSASKIQSHISHYEVNKLLKKMTNMTELCKHLKCNQQVFSKTIVNYNKSVIKGKDEFDKIVFPNKIDVKDSFYIGFVTPVLHYCMGGIEINNKTQVITKDGAIDRLYAAGEVTSGVHGSNRLGGNSLAECTVYGKIAGEQSLQHLSTSWNYSVITDFFSNIWNSIPSFGFSKKVVSQEELTIHNKEDDAWMAIDDKVYDVTKYINEHPGGKEAILRYIGKDATKAFYQIHEKYMLEKLPIIGIYKN